MELLEESGEIPCELQEKIRNLENLETLKVLLKLAARADSLHTFEEKRKSILIQKIKSERSAMILHCRKQVCPCAIGGVRGLQSSYIEERLIDSINFQSRLLTEEFYISKYGNSTFLILKICKNTEISCYFLKSCYSK